MSNLVAITYKYNKELIKIAQPVGLYNSLMFSEDFCLGNIGKALNEHTKSFIAMQEDYLRHSDIEIFDLEKTHIYGKYQLTVPINKKLVVCDFNRKIIHSIKDHYPVGKQHFSWLFSNNNRENAQFLLNKNLLLVYDIISKRSYTFKEVFGTQIIEEIDNIYKNTENNLINKLVSQHVTSFLSITTYWQFKHLYIIPTILKNYEFKIYDYNNLNLLDFFDNLVQTSVIKKEQEMNAWLDIFTENINIYYNTAPENEKLILNSTIGKTKIELTKYIQKLCFDYKIISKFSLFRN